MRAEHHDLALLVGPGDLGQDVGLHRVAVEEAHAHVELELDGDARARAAARCGRSARRTGRAREAPPSPPSSSRRRTPAPRGNSRGGSARRRPAPSPRRRIGPRPVQLAALAVRLAVPARGGRPESRTGRARRGTSRRSARTPPCPCGLISGSSPKKTIRPASLPLYCSRSSFEEALDRAPPRRAPDRRSPASRPREARAAPPDPARVIRTVDASYSQPRPNGPQVSRCAFASPQARELRPAPSRWPASCSGSRSGAVRCRP